jgi:hypothetical protein
MVDRHPRHRRLAFIAVRHAVAAANRLPDIRAGLRNRNTNAGTVRYITGPRWKLAELTLVTGQPNDSPANLRAGVTNAEFEKVAPPGGALLLASADLQAYLTNERRLLRAHLHALRRLATLHDALLLEGLRSRGTFILRSAVGEALLVQLLRLVAALLFASRRRAILGDTLIEKFPRGGRAVVFATAQGHTEFAQALSVKGAPLAATGRRGTVFIETLMQDVFGPRPATVRWAPGVDALRVDLFRPRYALIFTAQRRLRGATRLARLQVNAPFRLAGFFRAAVSKALLDLLLDVMDALSDALPGCAIPTAYSNPLGRRRRQR